MKNYNGSEEVRRAWQTWHEGGERCPKGTVPIRRSTVNDVLRAKSLYHFGKKQRRVPLDRYSDAPDVVSGNGHEVSFLFCSLSLHVCISSFSFFFFLFPCILLLLSFNEILSYIFYFKKLKKKRKKQKRHQYVKLGGFHLQFQTDCRNILDK